MNVNANVDQKRVVTGRVRLSYCHLTKPRVAKPGDTPKYGVTLLIPKSDVATRQRMDAAIGAAILDAIQGKWNGVRPAQPAVPIYDGDGVRPNGEAFSEECRGHWVVTASSELKPDVVDVNCNPIINETEIYSGMYAHVSIRFFGYFNSGKKGIGCGLGNVQKVADGEVLGGGRRSAMDDFAGGGGYPGAAAPAYGQPVAYAAPGYTAAPAAQTYSQQPAPGYTAAPAAQTYSQQPAPGYPAPAPAYAAPVQQGYAVPTPAPVAPAAVPMQNVQIDPITGRPVVGQVMGLG